MNAALDVMYNQLYCVRITECNRTVSQKLNFSTSDLMRLTVNTEVDDYPAVGREQITGLSEMKTVQRDGEQ